MQNNLQLIRNSEQVYNAGVVASFQESSSVSGDSNKSLPATDKNPFASGKPKADFNYGKLANQPQKCMTPIAE